jgi:hypothetical protein
VRENERLKMQVENLEKKLVELQTTQPEHAAKYVQGREVPPQPPSVRVARAEV